MRVLWLGWDELYTTGRMQEAAGVWGIELDTCELFDLDMAVEPGRVGLFRGDQDVLQAYDVLVVRTFYPYISEALTVARLFRDAGKVVIDHSLTDEGYAVSKMHDYLVLAQQGIAVPASWQIFDPAQIEQVAGRLGYPCVLKGVHGAHGTHVYLVENAARLRRRLWRYPCGELMLQEYLPAERDYRVIVIGYRALPMMVSRTPPPGDFRTNFAVGGAFEGHPLAEFPDFGRLAEQSARALRREFAAVDLRMRGGQPMVLEVNRRPDFKGFEQATGMDVAGEFLHYVQQRFKGEVE